MSDVLKSGEEKQRGLCRDVFAKDIDEKMMDREKVMGVDL